MLFPRVPFIVVLEYILKPYSNYYGPYIRDSVTRGYYEDQRGLGRLGSQPMTAASVEHLNWVASQEKALGTNSYDPYDPVSTS